MGTGSGESITSRKTRYKSMSCRMFFAGYVTARKSISLTEKMNMIQEFKHFIGYIKKRLRRYDRRKRMAEIMDEQEKLAKEFEKLLHEERSD